MSPSNPPRKMYNVPFLASQKLSTELIQATETVPFRALRSRIRRFIPSKHHCNCTSFVKSCLSFSVGRVASVNNFVKPQLILQDRRQSVRHFIHPQAHKFVSLFSQRVTSSVLWTREFVSLFRQGVTLSMPQSPNLIRSFCQRAASSVSRVLERRGYHRSKSQSLMSPSVICTFELHARSL